MYRRVIVACLLWLVLMPAWARAADVQATLDRSSVQLGDTVTLNVRITGAGAGIGMPDLGGLSKDFNVLGTSQNSSLSIVNGAVSSTLTIGVALRPTHVGTLQIPALSVAGGQTRPLQLEVTAAAPMAAATAQRNVFMEAQIEPKHGYVGQQWSYVVKLYYAINLSDGALDVPPPHNAAVSRVGDDLNYDAQRDGRTYHVLERRYAVTPQHVGSLEMPAANFRGAAIDPNDPDSFFGASTPVSAIAPALTVDVQAVPAEAGQSAWLPARQLSLTLDGWPAAQDQVRVGQPLNLTLSLQATGLPFEALPALSLPTLNGATVYPDKPVTGTRVDGLWLVGRQQQTFAVVPERAGTLIMPAITLKWWNVLTDRAEEAQLPARSLTVLPATGVAPGQPAQPLAVSASPHPGVPAATPIPRAAHTTPWRWIALGSVGLWLLSVLAWWWWRTRRAKPVLAAPSAAQSPRQHRQAFLAAANGDDPAAQARTLLAWARAERPVIQHLSDLAAALGDPAQRAAIVTLQQRQYADTPRPAAGAKLAEVFQRGFVWCAAAADEATPALPPLYPFKLH